ncbi:MAG: YdcH family protein [Caulobacterales bacterium]|nr:YdcH family protein [Caulobacterales bacterium]
MTLEARIAELTARHHDLDEAITEELRRPSIDSVRVSEMKKRKLRLKDQIAALERGH